MKYFYCEDCEEIFPEEQAGEKVREWGYGDKKFASCPNCKSIELREAETCLICGEAIVPDSVPQICTECAEALHRKWVALVEEVGAIRHKASNGLPEGFLDCEQAALDFLDEVGII